VKTTTFATSLHSVCTGLLLVCIIFDLNNKSHSMHNVCWDYFTCLLFYI
jgi:hypothetical protein